MLSEKDLQALEDAAELIVRVLERHRVHEEDAAERQALFRLLRTEKDEKEDEEKRIKHSADLKFNKKEIEAMPMFYKKLFFTGTAVAHWRIRKDGLYEIRCQIKKKKITATGKTLEAAKKKFLYKLGEAEDVEREVQNVAPSPKAEASAPSVTFEEYAEEWLETVKRKTIKEATYRDYRQIFNYRLFPTFGAFPLSEIKRQDVQKYLNGMLEEGKSRTAHKIRRILAALFDYAVEDDLVKKSPISRIELPYHEDEHGKALTKTEEEALVRRCLNNTRTGKAILLILYTGLRRSELEGAKLVEKKWIKVISAKQRAGRREKERLIPISPRLRKVLPLLETELESLKLYPNRLTRTFKAWFPDHHLHDLRHTFITRAQECGISRELVSLWAGHKADNTMTSNVYTHFSEEFQLAEIMKFDY